MHRVVKTIEIDYGHTLPNHFGFCNQIHGHRAKIEVAVLGHIQADDAQSDQGMVMDFGLLKEIMMQKIHKILDHGFAIWKDDKTMVPVTIRVPIDDNTSRPEIVKISMIDFMLSRNTKVLATDLPPTAEVLAEWAFHQIHYELEILTAAFKIPAVQLEWVKWYETPNSYAQYPRMVKIHLED